MKKFSHKEKEYLNEVERKIKRSKEFIEYSEKLGNPKDAVEKYLLSLCLSLKEPVKPRKNIPQDREEHVQMLENTGEFLAKTTKLEEIKKEYNKSVLENTESFAGNVHNNPFVITKKQLAAEFYRERNEKLSDVELDIKSCFWENKVIKTIEGIRNAYCDKYSEEKGLEDIKAKVGNGIIKNFGNDLIVSKCNCLEIYKQYILGNITRKELEKDNNYKRAKQVARDISKKIYKDSTKLELDFLLQSKLFSSTIDERYRYKNIYVQRTLTRTKEDKDIKLGVYKERYEENNQDYIPCGFTMKNYNTESIVHVNKKDYNKIKNKVSPNYKDILCESFYVESTLLFRYTDKQIESIDELTKNRENLSVKERRVLDFFVRNKNPEEKENYMKKFEEKQEQFVKESKKINKDNSFERGDR